MSNAKVGRAAVKARRRPGGPGASGGSNYHTFGGDGVMSKRKAEKSIIYKAVPLRKDNRIFSR